MNQYQTMKANPAETAMRELVTLASRAATRGAQEYLRAHGLTADERALAECLKTWVRLKLPEALADAKAALDCHMTQVAQATFTASMVQAGIQAAKEAAMAEPVQRS